MPTYKSLKKGYYYRIDKNGKKTRITKEVYLRHKSTSSSKSRSKKMRGGDNEFSSQQMNGINVPMNGSMNGSMNGAMNGSMTTSMSPTRINNKSRKNQMNLMGQNPLNPQEIIQSTNELASATAANIVQNAITQNALVTANTSVQETNAALVQANNALEQAALNPNQTNMNNAKKAVNNASKAAKNSEVKVNNALQVIEQPVVANTTTTVELPLNIQQTVSNNNKNKKNNKTVLEQSTTTITTPNSTTVKTEEPKKGFFSDLMGMFGFGGTGGKKKTSKSKSKKSKKSKKSAKK